VISLPFEKDELFVAIILVTLLVLDAGLPMLIHRATIPDTWRRLLLYYTQLRLARRVVVVVFVRLMLAPLGGTHQVSVLANVLVIGLQRRIPNLVTHGQTLLFLSAVKFASTLNLSWRGDKSLKLLRHNIIGKINVLGIYYPYGPISYTLGLGYLADHLRHLPMLGRG
jgi:hypothetical protein